jgi:hypothetical protein
MNFEQPPMKPQTNEEAAALPSACGYHLFPQYSLQRVELPIGTQQALKQLYPEWVIRAPR